MTRGLVVSLHDVCPRTREACAVILTELDRLGLRRRSLLVIPAEPGAELDEPCANWLRGLAARGDEIVQHGLYHRRCASPGTEHPPVVPPKSGALTGPLPDSGEGWGGVPERGAHAHPRQPGEPDLSAGARLLDAVLARGAGEFLGLDQATALARLAAGRRRLDGLGLSAAGFVAPAWLYSRASATAVRALGFRYLTTHLRLRDLETGHDTWSFGISNRPGPLGGDLLGRGVNELFRLLHGPLPLVRIAIHPADLEHGRPFEHTMSLLTRLLRAGREPLTYLDWCERRPGPRP